MHSQSTRNNQNAIRTVYSPIVLSERHFCHLITSSWNNRPTRHDFAQLLQTVLHTQHLIPAPGFSHGSASTTTNNENPIQPTKLFFNFIKSFLLSDRFHRH